MRPSLLRGTTIMSVFSGEASGIFLPYSGGLELFFEQFPVRFPDGFSVTSPYRSLINRSDHRPATDNKPSSQKHFKGLKGCIKPVSLKANLYGEVPETILFRL